MKKLFNAIALFFASLSITSPQNMDPVTKNNLKAAAFDSFDDTFDDTFDEDGDGYDLPLNEVDNFKGKRKPSMSLKPSGAVNPWIATSGYFTINVVNNLGAAQKMELFSSLRNAVWADNTTLFPTFHPFTFSNRAAANANNTVVFNATGDMVITDNAGNTIVISCVQIPYRTLLESLKFYRISIKSTKMSFTNTTQLDNDITHITQTFLGKVEQNTFTPRVYFRDDQFQSKQVTIPQGYIIDGERGLNFTINSGETLSFNFTLNGIMKA